MALDLAREIPAQAERDAGFGHDEQRADHEADKVVDERGLSSLPVVRQ